MEARMTNPTNVLDGAMKPIMDLFKAIHSAGVPDATLELVHLRTSQINGCNYCSHYHKMLGKKAGLSEAQITRRLRPVRHVLATASLGVETASCINSRCRCGTFIRRYGCTSSSGRMRP